MSEGNNNLNGGGNSVNMNTVGNFTYELNATIILKQKKQKIA